MSIIQPNDGSRHRKRTKNPAIWALLIAVGITFMMMTCFFKSMHVLFEKNTEDSLATRIDLANQSVMGMNNLILFLAGDGAGLIFLIGDAVSVWCAWAILTPNRKPVYGLIGLLLVGMMLLLATNLHATGLIAYKAYTYRGFMQATLGLGQSKVTKVLIVVTESGAAYCVIQDLVAQLWNQFTLFVSRSITDTLQGTQGSGAVSGFRRDVVTHMFARSMRTTRADQDLNTEELTNHHSNGVEVEGRSEGMEEGKRERHDVV
ncbi:hypothetical protein B0H10DRAFT_2328439 [Mycena sp. CBHHK59/15]|nr:hypothetical protein B0H10DRAFT_2328439 [Mycena sp. CBHHK59/15]